MKRIAVTILWTVIAATAALMAQMSVVPIEDHPVYVTPTPAPDVNVVVDYTSNPVKIMRYSQSVDPITGIPIVSTDYDLLATTPDGMPIVNTGDQQTTTPDVITSVTITIYVGVIGNATIRQCYGNTCVEATPPAGTPKCGRWTVAFTSTFNNVPCPPTNLHVHFDYYQNFICNGGSGLVGEWDSGSFGAGTCARGYIVRDSISTCNRDCTLNAPPCCDGCAFQAYDGNGRLFKTETTNALYDAPPCCDPVTNRTWGDGLDMQFHHVRTYPFGSCTPIDSYSGVCTYEDCNGHYVGGCQPNEFPYPQWTVLSPTSEVWDDIEDCSITPQCPNRGNCHRRETKQLMTECR